MPAELMDDHVLITPEDEASQIYNRGYHGEPQSGGALKLTLIEAIWLTELGRISVRRKKHKVDLERLIRHAKKVVDNFEIKYVVYRDLRQRGYVVKPHIAPVDFQVLPRGGAPNKNQAKYWVLALSERSGTG
jgi:tRNA-intron endonuclease